MMIRKALLMMVALMIAAGAFSTLAQTIEAVDPTDGPFTIAEKVGDIPSREGEEPGYGPPAFPDPTLHTPERTHQRRPILEWSEAWEYNENSINYGVYTVNVYSDELYTGEQVIKNVIVPAQIRPPQYTFTKNLRYNRVYWVEIVASDPMANTDSITFSFETYNTPPSIPVIDLERTPVSNGDDITVVVTNASKDVDVNPRDFISYLVEWYVYKENTWVILASGFNMMTLSSDKTNEGDRIKIVVKPYDGIEYGPSTELIFNIENLVPEVLIGEGDVTINEDEEGLDMLYLMNHFTDREGDDLSFRVKSQRHVQATIDPVSSAVSFIPDPNWVGSDTVVIEAFDAKIHQEDWPTVTINVKVLSVNDAPTIDLVNDEPVGPGETVIIQGIQGSTCIITVGASDFDEIYGDTWKFSTNFRSVINEEMLPASDYQFEVNSGRLSAFLPNSMVGDHLFEIIVTDSHKASSSVPIRLIVENINDFMTDPVITSPTDSEVLTQQIGKRVLFQARDCYDPDLSIPNSKEKLTYEWYFSDGEQITNAGTLVEHRFGVTGNYTVRLVVKDSYGAQKDTSIKIFVEVLETPLITLDPVEDNDYGTLILIIILAVIALIFLAMLLFFILRKDPLSRTAEKEEEAHEALVAQQQQDALEAQEKLQALLSGAAYQEVSGPALPSATGGGPEMEALPAAPTDEQLQEPSAEAAEPQMQEPPAERL
ncbi:MAG: PKD domain-containing protein [Candidatus Thermoplasmatota archaeon]|nr:PKD domain-containing protein [Candidatus Thermoplasmatota archaeon]